MASIIPKIKIGLAASKREKHNLSFDCSTTANIGSIQPTMCRELVPNSKMKVKVSSLCRLASMPLPTFGRISLRHYHCFVPYVDLWQPFDAMMSGQHYQGNGHFIPSTVPWFTFDSLLPLLSNLCDFSFAFEYDLNNPFTITETTESWDGHVYDTVDEAQAADKLRIETVWAAVKNATAFGGAGLFSMFNMRASSSATWRTDQYGSINAGAYVIRPRNATTTFTFAEPGVSNPDIWYSGATPITAEGADLITKIGDYAVLVKFRPEMKRLRTIFIGLGYQFSPYNTERMSVLKILAYYKAWFNLFSPDRERAFVDTPCYQIIKHLSDYDGMVVTDSNTNSQWTSLLMELATSCYYYLPMDYFAMSVTRPMQSNQDNSFVMSAGENVNGESVTVEGHNNNSTRPNVNFPSNPTTGVQSPLTLRLAQRMLTWANKNTVLGRSIREYLKVHFGVSDTNAIDNGGIYRIGSSRTNIQISDVMSTAESQQGYLGEYGGKGIGYGDSEKFDFTADKFGVWLTLTVVVPESGYYQGYMKENRHLTRYQFFNPEFDALGYQVLERGEVMDDYNCDGSSWNPKTEFKRTEAFGLVPRYSEYKVGRNVVNGDFSLISLYNSMAPYTLDRRIAGGAYENVPGVDHYGLRVTKPKFVPSVVYDAFRRIDPTDHLGQYNRIFNYGGNDLDHFLMHHIFDVVLHAPMKSLSESFDTITNDDDGTIDVTHS